MIVSDIDLAAVEDGTELSATVQGLRTRRSRSRLWFRFAGVEADRVSRQADPFLAALLPLAMIRRQPLVIEGQVSQQLCDSCHTIMRTWARWYRRLRVIDIQPVTTGVSPHTPDATAAFFTAGVDSFYTVLVNLADDPPDGRIGQLLYVPSFDIPPGMDALRREVVDRIGRVADHLGLGLVVVTSNLRSLSDGLADWGLLQHGAALASVGLALSPWLRRVYIAASDIEPSPAPWGTHPRIDPLWSNGATEFVHHGCDASRAQKTMVVGRSRIAREHLRVCTPTREGVYNCGECEKCTRTKVNLRMAGVLQDCPTLPGGLVLERVRRIPLDHLLSLEYYPDNLKLLSRGHGDPELEQALRDALDRFPSWLLAAHGSARRIDRMVLGGGAATGNPPRPAHGVRYATEALVNVTLIMLAHPQSSLTVGAHGLRYLSACLKRAGHRTRLIVLYGDNDHHVLSAQSRQLVELVQDADLIGLSFMSYFFDSAVQLTRRLKRALDVPIVWGGVHPTVRPRECLDHVELVCRGEGEEAIVELADRIEAGRDVADVRNIWCRTDDRVVENPVRTLIDDLDGLPFPDLDFDTQYLLDPTGVRRMTDEIFLQCSTWNGSINYAIFAGRGCPHRCSYCAQAFYHDLHRGEVYHRRRSISSVISELEAAKQRWPELQGVDFWEDSFPYLGRDLEEFCARYRDEIGLPFRVTGFTPGAVTRRRLEALTGAGMCGVMMGIQSVSRSSERVLNRNTSKEVVRRAAEVIHEFQDRIPMPRYDIILDNPWESEEDNLETLAFLATLAPPFTLALFSLTFLPGTELYGRAEREGILPDAIRRHDYPHFMKPHPTLVNKLFALLGDHAKLGEQLSAETLTRLTHPVGRRLGASQALYALLKTRIKTRAAAARIRSWTRGLVLGPRPRSAHR